jgi:hypothetical protein
MDHAPDAGIGWRKKLKEDTKHFNIAWLDPTDKPCSAGLEGPDEVAEGKRLMDAERYDEASVMFTEIAAIDMELVSLSNFIVARLDLAIQSCGTHWEMCRANDLGKPVLTWIVQGKRNAPRWLFGSIPHHMIFSNADELKAYLKHIAYDQVITTHGRWQFFDIKSGGTGE